MAETEATTVQDFPNGKNDTRNVSTTRGVRGGYLFFAPEGSNLPTGLNDQLDPAFKCGGFASEDGFKEDVDSSSETIKDFNVDDVDTYSEGSTETLAITLIEMSEESLGVQYGHENVSQGDGCLIVKHNWSKAEETLSCVMELVLKNGRRWRKVIPKCSVTERATFEGNATTPAGREITLTYKVDDEGNGCIDYIENVDKPAGAEPPQEVTPETVSTSGGSDISAMTNDQLRTYAAEQGIDVTGAKSKTDLISAINAANETN